MGQGTLKLQYTRDKAASRRENIFPLRKRIPRLVHRKSEEPISDTVPFSEQKKLNSLPVVALKEYPSIRTGSWNSAKASEPMMIRMFSSDKIGQLLSRG
jgi:hypothetical protein